MNYLDDGGYAWLTASYSKAHSSTTNITKLTFTLSQQGVSYKGTRTISLRLINTLPIVEYNVLTGIYKRANVQYHGREVMSEILLEEVDTSSSLTLTVDLLENPYLDLSGIRGGKSIVLNS